MTPRPVQDTLWLLCLGTVSGPDPSDTGSGPDPSDTGPARLGRHKRASTQAGVRALPTWLLRPTAKHRDDVWGVHTPPPDEALTAPPTGPSRFHSPAQTPVWLACGTAPGQQPSAASEFSEVHGTCRPASLLLKGISGLFVLNR